MPTTFPYPPPPPNNEVDKKSFDYYFLAALSASRRLTYFQTLPCETSARYHQIVRYCSFILKLMKLIRYSVCQGKIIKRSDMGESFVYCLARPDP